jgi:hypothetical protein
MVKLRGLLGGHRPRDSDLLIAIDTHRALPGRVPRLVAADAAFYSANEAAVKSEGRQAHLYSQIARPKP